MANHDTTRLLLLGAASMFEPVNGYQLRRELLSWGIEGWAHVNPGSIYSMLTTLAKQEMLVRAEVAPEGGRRSVAVYHLTSAGRDDLLALCRSSIAGVRSLDRTAFYAGMSFAPFLFPRDGVIGLLEERRRRLREAGNEAIAIANALDQSVPAHIPLLMRYSVAVDRADEQWLEGFITSIRDGVMTFTDDN